ARGVRPFAVVDGEREEVLALLAGALRGGGEDDGLAEANERGARRLARDLAGLDRQRATGDLSRNARRRLQGYEHTCIPLCCLFSLYWILKMYLALDGRESPRWGSRSPETERARPGGLSRSRKARARRARPDVGGLGRGGAWSA